MDTTHTDDPRSSGYQSTSQTRRQVDPSFQGDFEGSEKHPVRKLLIGGILVLALLVLIFFVLSPLLFRFT